MSWRDDDGPERPLANLGFGLAVAVVALAACLLAGLLWRAG